MPAKLEWTDAQDTLIHRMRGEGATWDEIGAALALSASTARDRGFRINARLPPPDFIPEARDPSPLPAGHPSTWGLLTAGTVLEGHAYEYRAPGR